MEKKTLKASSHIGAFGTPTTHGPLKVVSKIMATTSIGISGKHYFIIFLKSFSNVDIIIWQFNRADIEWILTILFSRYEMKVIIIFTQLRVGDIIIHLASLTRIRC